MKNQVSKFQEIVLTTNEQTAVKGGGLPVAFAHGNMEPTSNGLFYPCGLPVVSNP